MGKRDQTNSRMPDTGSGSTSGSGAGVATESALFDSLLLVHPFRLPSSSIRPADPLLIASCSFNLSLSQIIVRPHKIITMGSQDPVSFLLLFFSHLFFASSYSMTHYFFLIYDMCRAKNSFGKRALQTV